MKSERRHELQHNELSDWVTHQIEAIKPFGRTIFGVLVAILVVLGVYWFVSNRANAALAEGWDSNFFAILSRNPKNFSSTIAAHGNDSAALWAHVLLGETQLNDGMEKLFSDRTEASNQLNKANDNFQATLDAAPAKDAMLRERATWGLARGYEAVGNFDKARGAYEALTKNWENGPYTEMARARLGDLNRDQTMEFYAWFAKQTPVKAPPRPISGKPEFTLPGLDPSIKLPSAADLDVSPLSEKPGDLNPDRAKPDATPPDASQKPADDASPLGDKPAVPGDAPSTAKPDVPTGPESKPAAPKSEADKPDAAKVVPPAAEEPAKSDPPKSDDKPAADTPKTKTTTSTSTTKTTTPKTTTSKTTPPASKPGSKTK